MNAIDTARFVKHEHIKVVITVHFDERLGKWYELVIFGKNGGIVIANLINASGCEWTVAELTEHGDKFNGITEFARTVSKESVQDLATSIVDYAAAKAA